MIFDLDRFCFSKFDTSLISKYALQKTKKTDNGFGDTKT